MNIKKLNTAPGLRKFLEEEPVEGHKMYRFLISFYKKHENIPGCKKTFKNMINQSDEKYGYWFNYFSEIRCANYIETEISRIKRFNIKSSGNRDCDFLTEDSNKWEVVSFTPNSEHKKIFYEDDETIIECMADKIKEKFTLKKPDYVIVDDIFADNSKKFKKMIVLWDEVDDLKKIFKKHFGNYLRKIIVLSFTCDMTINPSIRYCGPEIKKLMKQ